MKQRTYLTFGAGAHLVSGAVKAPVAIGKKVINGLAKQPVESLRKVAADLVEDNIIQPDVAEATLKEIEKQKAFMSQFPEVKTDADLDHVEGLMKEYEANKAKLAKPEEGGIHEALQKPVKERQKEVEWEIGVMQQKPEDQIKSLKLKQQELQKELDDHDAAKAEGKVGKLADRAAVKKRVNAIEKRMGELQERVDSPLHKAAKIIEEDIRDDYADWTQNEVYKSMSEQDPEGLVKFIADQAQDPATRSATESLFGKELVGMAETAFPSKFESVKIEKGEKPSIEQQFNEVKNGDVVTFTYDNEGQVPKEFRNRVSSVTEVNGDKTVRVTVPKSLADHHLHLQEQAASKSEQGKMKVAEEKFVEDVHARSKVELPLEYIPDEVFVKASDPRAARRVQVEIRKRHSILKQLVNCK
jgi:hypothetical protein